MAALPGLPLPALPVWQHSLLEGLSPMMPSPRPAWPFLSLPSTEAGVGAERVARLRADLRAYVPGPGVPAQPEWPSLQEQGPLKGRACPGPALTDLEPGPKDPPERGLEAELDSWEPLDAPQLRVATVCGKRRGLACWKALSVPADVAGLRWLGGRGDRRLPSQSSGGCAPGTGLPRGPLWPPVCHTGGSLSCPPLP